MCKTHCCVEWILVLFSHIEAKSHTVAYHVPHSFCLHLCITRNIMHKAFPIVQQHYYSRSYYSQMKEKLVHSADSV